MLCNCTHMSRLAAKSLSKISFFFYLNSEAFSFSLNSATPKRLQQLISESQKTHFWLDSKLKKFQAKVYGYCILFHSTARKKRGQNQSLEGKASYPSLWHCYKAVVLEFSAKGSQSTLTELPLKCSYLWG